MVMKADEGFETIVTTDFSRVKQTQHGHLQASGCSVSMCGCGRLWIGGEDAEGREFVQLPISPETARAIAFDLLKTADLAEAARGSMSKHKH